MLSHLFVRIYLFYLSFLAVFHTYIQTKYIFLFPRETSYLLCSAVVGLLGVSWDRFGPNEKLCQKSERILFNRSVFALSIDRGLGVCITRVRDISNHYAYIGLISENYEYEILILISTHLPCIGGNGFVYPSCRCWANKGCCNSDCGGSLKCRTRAMVS